MVGTYRWPSLLPRRRPSLSARPASRPTKCFSSIYEMVSRSIEKRNAADQRCAALLGNNREVTSTWHRSPSPSPNAPALSWRFCWRNFSRPDRFRFSPPFRTPPDLFHGPSPSHPCNPCLTSTFPLPSPPATRRFPPWQSLSNLHSPCCDPSPSALRIFSLRYRSHSPLLHGPLPLPSFRLWPHPCV